MIHVLAGIALGALIAQWRDWKRTGRLEDGPFQFAVGVAGGALLMLAL